MKRPRVKTLLVVLFVAPIAVVLAGAALLVVSGLNDHIGKADVALVLGNKVELDGTPSLRLRARLDRTLELYRAGYFSTVITSGGIGVEGFDEALVMKNYLVSHGIPASAVIVDNTGANTFLSAKATRDILQQRQLKSVLVISQHYHLPRSRLALERFGVATVYSAHAKFWEARDAYSAVRETFGYASYSFRSY